MNIENTSSLIFIGLFFTYWIILSTIFTPLLKYLLNGPLRQFSKNYFADFAREQFDTAAGKNDPDKAWEEIGLAKIREIGHSKTPYEKRRQNLLYIQNITPTKRIAEGLVEVLPNQHNLSFQHELVCMLCSILAKFRNGDAGNVTNYSVLASPLNMLLKALNLLLASWLASVSLLILYWTRLDNYSFLGIASHCLLAFAFMLYPVSQVKIKFRSSLSYASFSISAILMALALFAFVNHSGVEQKLIVLDGFGYTGLSVTINYPKWITIDEIQSCNKTNTISVLVQGGSIPAPMKFNFDQTLYAALNDDCKLTPPEANDSNTNGDAYEFYFSLLDREALSKQEAVITPVILFSNGPISLDKYKIKMHVEQAHWGIIRQLIYIISSGGGISFLVLTAQLFSFLKNRE